jgi:hypothetical protein
VDTSLRARHMITIADTSAAALMLIGMALSRYQEKTLFGVRSNASGGELESPAAISPRPSVHRR